MGRSRSWARAGQKLGRSRPGVGQKLELGISRSRAGQKQGRNRARGRQALELDWSRNAGAGQEQGQHEQDRSEAGAGQENCIFFGLHVKFDGQEKERSRSGAGAG